MVRYKESSCCSCSLTDISNTPHVHTTNQGAEEFLGMPFGHAARFEPPVDFKGKYKTEVIQTKYFGHACESEKVFSVCATSSHFFGFVYDKACKLGTCRV